MKYWRLNANTLYVAAILFSCPFLHKVALPCDLNNNDTGQSAYEELLQLLKHKLIPSLEKKRKTSVSNLEHYDGLTKMFSKFIDVYNELPSVVEVTPENQNQITNMYKGLVENAQ